MRNLDKRTLILILSGSLLGALWAWLSLGRAGGDRGEAALAALVWTIMAVPLGCFVGWGLARPGELWRAALACLGVYLFGVLLAARLERLALGQAQAEQSAHALYFSAVIVAQTLAALAIGLYKGLRHS